MFQTHKKGEKNQESFSDIQKGGEIWHVFMYRVTMELQLPEAVVLVRAKETKAERKRSAPFPWRSSRGA